METAQATISGFGTMRMFKKGRFGRWIDAVGGGTKAHIVHRLFDPCA